MHSLGVRRTTCACVSASFHEKCTRQRENRPDQPSPCTVHDLPPPERQDTSSTAGGRCPLRVSAGHWRPRTGSQAPLFLSSQVFGSQSSTLFPSGSMIHANLPFS